MKSVFYIVGCTILLSACSMITSEECHNAAADWAKVGSAHALKGEPMLLEKYRHDCWFSNIKPDTDKYIKGYNAGAVQYCTYQNGFDSGAAGKSIAGICEQPRLTIVFHRAYDKGAVLYCTYENGFKDGLNDRRITGICEQPNLSGTFHDGYTRGQKHFHTKEMIEYKESSIRDAEQQITELSAKEEKAVKKEVSMSDDDFKKLLSLKQSLELRKDHAKDDLENLREKLMLLELEDNKYLHQ